jgi:hypothetical protein
MTRCVLISASGLDWAGFKAATRSGETPALAALAEKGAATWLAGAPLGDGPAVWASMATGAEAESHGIWRRQEAWPGGVRPVGRSSWRVAPVWAKLEAAGIATGSVHWPATRNGADWAGAHIDETFASPTGRFGEDWALPLHCAPEAARAALRDRRVHPTDITAAMLRPFVPAIAEIDQSRDARLPTLALAMARAATVQAAAAWLLGETASEAAFIHLPWLGEVRTAFGRRREGPFAGVVAAAWRFLDGLVARIVELAGPGSSVILASPGWGGAPGVFLAAGHGDASDGAYLRDIAPTVLGLYGLADPSLPGRRLVGEDRPLSPAPEASIEPIETDAALLAEAVDAGYAPPPEAPPAWRAHGLAELAWLLLERDPDAAGRVADAALAVDRANIMALRARVRAHVLLDEAAPLIDLSAELYRLAPDRPWGSLARGAFHVLRGEKGLAGSWLRRAEIGGDAFDLMTAATLWTAARRWSDAERVFRRILEVEPQASSAQIGLAMALKARRDFLGAEEVLGAAADQDPGRPAIWLQFADLYARTGRSLEAGRAADAAAAAGAGAEHVAAARIGRLG